MLLRNWTEILHVSDHISLGVIARRFPLEDVRQVLTQSGRASQRERDLPAHVIVYYYIELGLCMESSTREVLRCLLEGLCWVWRSAVVHVAGKRVPLQSSTYHANRNDKVSYAQGLIYFDIGQKGVFATEPLRLRRDWGCRTGVPGSPDPYGPSSFG